MYVCMYVLCMYVYACIKILMYVYKLTYTSINKYMYVQKYIYL